MGKKLNSHPALHLVCRTDIRSCQTCSVNYYLNFFVTIMTDDYFDLECPLPESLGNSFCSCVCILLLFSRDINWLWLAIQDCSSTYRLSLSYFSGCILRAIRRPSPRNELLGRSTLRQDTRQLNASASHDPPRSMRNDPEIDPRGSLLFTLR